MSEINLTRDAFGRLVFIDDQGVQYCGVIPVRAFPISAPEAGIALMASDGRELLWIEKLADCPVAMQSVLQQELTQREFMPEIKRIVRVASFAMPSAWQVETDHGDYSLLLKSEDDIRRLPKQALLIADSNGIHFLIRDLTQLDKESRRILDRFL
ncbi:MAG: hypothetical protein RLZZ144_925 [Pseudomonadota bacterium]|jgi:hypothetical protein